jgi:hypothetical protein
MMVIDRHSVLIISQDEIVVSSLQLRSSCQHPYPKTLNFHYSISIKSQMNLRITVILEKPKVAQLLQKFSAIYGTPRVMTVLQALTSGLKHVLR